MPIISVRDNCEIIDERERQETKIERNKELILLCAQLFYKSNLELALSNILKERELYESERIVVQCKCLEKQTCYPF